MEKYTLIGHPLSHSMSPFIHAKLFEMANRTATYDCTDISPVNLKEEIAKINLLDGYNVTIPHKVSVIPFLHKLDTSAQRYGAVNCVNNQNGLLTGYNTDCDGFLLSVKNLPLSEKVLLLGCGGVGRMMAIEVALHKADLTIAIIEEAKPAAEMLLKEISEISPDSKVKVIDIHNINDNYNLLINATPVGMYPHSENCPVSEKVIENCDSFFDAIYNPTKTKLIKLAEKLDKPAVGGMAMLVYQAVKAHEIWNNDFYSDEQIKSLIELSEQKVMEDFKQ